MLSDSDFRFCLQQIEGRQRTRDKLPTFASIQGWLYPPRLNLEQCSSERTARYKAELLTQSSIVNRKSSNRKLLIDATGGYGVDTFFMSEAAAETHYFEQNAELAAVAEHNFRLAGKTIHCHPEPFDVQFLSDFIEGISGEHASDVGANTVLYIDPARRDLHGGKVFRLEDCTPNVVTIVRYVQRNCPAVRVLLKLSPMLDFHQAVTQLGGAWDVHVVSVANEVKELLLLSDGTNTIHAVSLDDTGVHSFVFSPDEEAAAEVHYQEADSLTGQFIFEPDAAILKAGAFRLIGARYGLMKAAPNTHLYFSSGYPFNRSSVLPVPGRCWQVVGVYTHAKELQRVLTRANVLTRNYVLPADALRSKLRLKDGGEDFVIGCRLADRPLLLHCRRV